MAEDKCAVLVTSLMAPLFVASVSASALQHQAMHVTHCLASLDGALVHKPGCLCQQHISRARWLVNSMGWPAQTAAHLSLHLSNRVFHRCMLKHL